MRVGLQKTSLIDYPGKLAFVVFLPGCNLRCPFCHNPGLVEPSRFPGTDEGLVELDEAFAYAKKRRNVLEAAVISGGEPCLRPELSDLIASMKGLGFLVKVDTNGISPEMLESLEADFVAMDLKTSLSRYRELPGAPDDAEARLRRSMEILRRRGMTREFRTTLAPGFAGAAEALELAGELEEDEDYVLQRFRPGLTLDPGFGESRATTEKESREILDAVRLVHAKTRAR
jgi:pyruvate formate lyase activating enzyme